ncbi:MAG: class I SAM-dependent methyltransferase [Dehalococcoidales bacterium]|nr:MAG: class I SAM-dependent methyltransferase [Dehalococcoidales bacterium]
METYGKLCTEFYDISKPEAPADALEFYLRHFSAAEGPVLEPMCGSGRFLIPFLEKGIDIDGVDASPHMLQACQVHCERKGLRPVLYQQLLQELDLPHRYAYIFIPAGSFGLVTDKKDAAESLQRLYQHLLPGGKLVIEIETTFAQPEVSGKWHEWRITRADGAELVFSALPMYDTKNQLQEDIHRYQLFNNGQLIETEIEHLSLRLYEPARFQKLLEDTGFADVRATRGYEDTKIDGGEKVVVFECRKM